jgi:hypothetical protein
VHACGGRGVEIARGAFAAGGDLLLVVPSHLKDSESLTFVARELLIVDGEAAADSTARALADAIVMVGPCEHGARFTHLVPAPGDLAASVGLTTAAPQPNSFANSVAEIVQGFLDISDRTRAPPDARIPTQRAQARESLHARSA